MIEMFDNIIKILHNYFLAMFYETFGLLVSKIIGIFLFNKNMMVVVWLKIGYNCFLSAFVKCVGYEINADVDK